jgi:signal peptidase
VTQNGAGQVVVLQPDGTLVRSIKTTRKSPSNLTFGGPDGKTVFVTQADRGYVEAFRVDRPGREPCMQFGAAFC